MSLVIRFVSVLTKIIGSSEVILAAADNFGSLIFEYGSRILQVLNLGNVPVLGYWTRQGTYRVAYYGAIRSCKDLLVN